MWTSCSAVTAADVFPPMIVGSLYGLLTVIGSDINDNLKVRRSMRNKYLKQLIYVVIPIITVFLCRLLKVAQGEKNEEIVFGIMLGILLDIIFFIIQKIRNR